jgi:hypothetical protein
VFHPEQGWSTILLNVSASVPNDTGSRYTTPNFRQVNVWALTEIRTSAEGNLTSGCSHTVRSLLRCFFSENPQLILTFITVSGLLSPADLQLLVFPHSLAEFSLPHSPTTSRRTMGLGITPSLATILLHLALQPWVSLGLLDNQSPVEFGRWESTRSDTSECPKYQETSYMQRTSGRGVKLTPPCHLRAYCLRNVWSRRFKTLQIAKACAAHHTLALTLSATRVHL